jgi:beta-glucosidase
VLAIYFRNPYVLDDASGLKEAGAIVAGFGVSDTALLEVRERTLQAGRQAAVRARQDAAGGDRQRARRAGYPAADTLYPFGYGLGY